MRFLTLLLVLLCTNAPAQTFTGGSGPVPDDGTVVNYPIQVSGLPGNVNILDFGLESVCFDITHTWTADLAVWIVAPDGTSVPLVSGIGGDTDGFVGTCVNSNANTSIFQQWYPYTGTFRPFGDMGQINLKGTNPNGTWYLRVLDTYPFADAGSLNWCSVTFGPDPCKPFVFESSDLPIIRISTGGQPIPNDPKITAQMSVIDNGPGQRNYPDQPGTAWSGEIGIELRGNSSQGFPKKSYAIETRDELGEDKDVSLLGLPETSDFGLMANFSDKTLMRNALAYDLFRQMGHYASRTRFCEVMLDGTYQGIYILTERIKRGDERVDIARLSPQDTSGTDRTGGYMLRIDWNTSPGWNSQFSQPNSPGIFTYFQHEYPEFDRLHPSQVQYIRSYVDSFEVALRSPDFQSLSTGWRRFADEKSFMDYLILNEVSKNVDGYRLSTYFHKDRDDRGGKLKMGPPWDYDLAFYNADYCEGFLASGWAYNINYVCNDAGVPFWWERLNEDTLFRQHLACRWQSLRSTNGAMSDARLGYVIDSMANILQEAHTRNFNYWPILGTYVWPNPGPLPDTYNGEIQKLKDWIEERTAWLDFAFSQNLPQLDAGFTAIPVNSLTWQFSAAPGWQYHWDFGDGTTSDEATPTHTFSSTGTWTVTLTISTPYGCSASSEQIIHIVSTGTTAAHTLQVQVSPNPATEVITVRTPGHGNTVALYNQAGQLVKSAQFQENITELRLQVAELPRGAYRLEVRGESGVANVMVSII